MYGYVDVCMYMQYTCKYKPDLCPAPSHQPMPWSTHYHQSPTCIHTTMQTYTHDWFPIKNKHPCACLETIQNEGYRLTDVGIIIMSINTSMHTCRDACTYSPEVILTLGIKSLNRAVTATQHQCVANRPKLAHNKTVGAIGKLRNTDQSNTSNVHSLLATYSFRNTQLIKCKAPESAVRPARYKKHSTIE